MSKIWLTEADSLCFNQILVTSSVSSSKFSAKLPRQTGALKTLLPLHASAPTLSLKD